MTGIIGLLKVELGAHTAYLSDAGFITYDGNTYTAEDSVLGTLASLDLSEEGSNGEIPALDMSFNVPGPISITTLTQGALQRGDVQLVTADYNPATNTIIGTPRIEFIGQLDQPVLRYSKSEYVLDVSAVSKAEWFFNRETGNGLSPAFHKSLFAGETGHDNASGLQVKVAWGTESPTGASGAAGGSGIGRFFGNMIRAQKQ